jgi:hypothetical protein
MIKRILERFRHDRGRLRATVKIDFYPQDQVTPHISWKSSQNSEPDTVPLVIHCYARILYELSELNELRVARELISFVDQVGKLVSTEAGPPRRPRLPLGQVCLVNDPGVPPVRTYQMEFYELPGGGHRLEYQGSLGKEGFYLPGAFLALVQSCLDRLEDETLQQLVRDLGRLHNYYRYRRDFWEGGALVSGPAFALGNEEIKPDEEVPDLN